MVPKETPGAKLIKWDEIPEYDQETQAVFEKAPVDKGDHIWVGMRIEEVEQDDAEEDDLF